MMTTTEFTNAINQARDVFVRIWFAGSRGQMVKITKAEAHNLCLGVHDHDSSLIKASTGGDALFIEGGAK